MRWEQLSPEQECVWNKLAIGAPPGVKGEDTGTVTVHLTIVFA
jgi:hypothetical protein